MRDSWKKSMRSIASGIMLLSALAVAPAAAQDVAVLPVSQWKVEAAPGDQVELSEKDGCLGISFNVATKKLDKGWISRTQGMFRILLKQPVPLKDDQERVIFDASGMEMQEKRSKLALLPIVRDASGELLVYHPYAYPHLKTGSKNWSRWMLRGR